MSKIVALKQLISNTYLKNLAWAAQEELDKLIQDHKQLNAAVKVIIEVTEDCPLEIRHLGQYDHFASLDNEPDCEICDDQQLEKCWHAIIEEAGKKS